MHANTSPRSILGVLRRFFIAGNSSIQMNEHIRASLFQLSTPTCTKDVLTCVRNFYHDMNTGRNGSRTKHPVNSYQTEFG
jgi:hypothetical protein